jgi:hypothetical protein
MHHTTLPGCGCRALCIPTFQQQNSGQIAQQVFVFSGIMAQLFVACVLITTQFDATTNIRIMINLLFGIPPFLWALRLPPCLSQISLTCSTRTLNRGIS